MCEDVFAERHGRSMKKRSRHGRKCVLYFNKGKYRTVMRLLQILGFSFRIVVSELTRASNKSALGAGGKNSNLTTGNNILIY